MQDEKKCYISGVEYGLHLHHIFHGPNRKISDRQGFTVYLRSDIHMALHDHRKPYEKLDGILKRECQRKFEETHTREEFMALIGRNYL